MTMHVHIWFREDGQMKPSEEKGEAALALKTNSAWPEGRGEAGHLHHHRGQQELASDWLKPIILNKNSL